MPMPSLSPVAQRLYNRLAPVTVKDASNGYALAYFCQGLAKMVDDIDVIVSDQPNGDIGWGTVFDVANVPSSWLPWVAQFVGVNLTGVTSVATQRSFIQNPQGFNRGTVNAMIAAAQATLTGTKSVFVTQRVSGNPWALTVQTLTSETPDSGKTLRAIQSQVPAWVILTYNTVTGGTYSVLPAHKSTYSAQLSAHPTYSDLRNNP